MPLYYFKCDSCSKSLRLILSPEDGSLPRACTCPNGHLVRDPRPPSSQAVETLDNGTMTKKLERLVDAERLYAERAEVVKKSQGGE